MPVDPARAILTQVLESLQQVGALKCDGLQPWVRLELKHLRRPRQFEFLALLLQLPPPSLATAAPLPASANAHSAALSASTATHLPQLWHHIPLLTASNNTHCLNTRTCPGCGTTLAWYTLSRSSDSRGRLRSRLAAVTRTTCEREARS